MVDYSKWENIGSEDEEEAAAQRPRPSGREDERLLEALHVSLRKAVKEARQEPGKDEMLSFGRHEGPRENLLSLTPEEQRTMVNFAAAQRSEGSNVALHLEIIQFLQQYPWLLSEKAMDCAAAASHKTAGDDDTQTAWIQAVNTLAACAKAGPVAFFTEVCTPATDAAREQRVKYEKKDFAKEFIIERIMGPMPEMPEDPLGDKMFWAVVVLFFVMIAAILYLIAMVKEKTHPPVPRASNITGAAVANASPEL